MSRAILELDPPFYIVMQSGAPNRGGGGLGGGNPL